MNEDSCVCFYTDGSYAFLKGRKDTFAGWGFAVFDMHATRVIAEATFYAQGQVFTTQSNQHYVGAQRHSNNTGEIAAVADALLWIILILQSPNEVALNELLTKPLLIVTDSA